MVEVTQMFLQCIFLAFVTGGSNDVQKADILINQSLSKFNHPVSSLTSRDTCSVGTLGSSNISEEFLCIALGYFNHIFRLSQCDQCDQGMLPNWFLKSPTQNAFFG